MFVIGCVKQHRPCQTDTREAGLCVVGEGLNPAAKKYRSTDCSSREGIPSNNWMPTLLVPYSSSDLDQQPRMIARSPFGLIIHGPYFYPTHQFSGHEYEIELAGRRLGFRSARSEGRNGCAVSGKFGRTNKRRDSAIWKSRACVDQAQGFHARKDRLVPILPVPASFFPIPSQNVKISGRDDSVPVLPPYQR